MSKDKIHFQSEKELVPKRGPSKEAFTWELQPAVLEQLKRLDSLLKKRNIHTLIGLELEFPDVNSDKVESIRTNILEELSLQTSEIEFITTATASELVVYQIYKSKLSHFLDPEFSASFNRKHIQDAEGVLEIKTLPLEITDFNLVRESLAKAIEQISLKFGIKKDEESAPNYHINISFNDEDGNLFDSSHKDFLSKGKALAEGMTYSLSRGLMFFYPQEDFILNRAKTPTLGTSRQSGFRFTNGRVEIKFINRNGAEQHVELVTLLAMTGSLYGLDNLDLISDIEPAEVVHTPSFLKHEGMPKVVNHLLNESIVGPDGNLVVNQAYIFDKIDNLLYELGLRDNPPKSHFFDYLIKLFKPEELDILIEFFQKIKIQMEDGKQKIIFPEDKEGIYYFVLPEKSMNLIPENIRERLRSGGKITRKECNEYILPGQKIPRAEVKKTIDIEKLRNNFLLKTLVPKFVVDEPIAETDSHDSSMQMHIERTIHLHRNRSLKYLNKEFNQVLFFTVNKYVKSLDSSL